MTHRALSPPQGRGVDETDAFKLHSGARRTPTNTYWTRHAPAVALALRREWRSGLLFAFVGCVLADPDGPAGTVLLDATSGEAARWLHRLRRRSTGSRTARKLSRS